MIAMLTFASGLGCGFVLGLGITIYFARAAYEDLTAKYRADLRSKERTIRQFAIERRATEELLYTRPHRRWNDNLVVGPWR